MKLYRKNFDQNAGKFLGINIDFYHMNFEIPKLKN